MNIENVKKLALLAEEYSVTAEPSLYCDGRIICPSGDMPLESCRFGQRATELWNKTQGEPDSGVTVTPGEMRGSFPIYVRYLHGEGIRVAISEHFRRCFNDNARFTATAKHKQVLAYEGDALVGIIMPIKTWTPPDVIDDIPIISFVDDGALYHYCEAA
jgi:hypothetical protein